MSEVAVAGALPTLSGADPVAIDDVARGVDHRADDGRIRVGAGVVLKHLRGHVHIGVAGTDRAQPDSAS